MVPPGLRRCLSRDGREGRLRLRALHREEHTKPKINPAHPTHCHSGLHPGWLQFLSKAAGLGSRPACTRCYFYSLGIVFPELFEKKKKKTKNFFDTFCIFFLKSGLWWLRFEVLTVLQGSHLPWKALERAPCPAQHPSRSCPGVPAGSPTRSQCPEGTRNSSKSSWEAFLSCLLLPYWGNYVFHSWGFVSLSTFLFPRRLGLFI